MSTPAPRAAVVRSISTFIEQQFGGRTMLFYDTTWAGGISETDTPLPSSASYSEFRGIALVRRWPFVVTYDGYIADNPGYGYRAQYHVEGFGYDERMPTALSAPERTRAAAQVASLLMASGAGGGYEAANISASAVVGSDSDGLLQVTAALPSTVSTAPPGFVEIGYAQGLLPATGIVDTAAR